MGPNRVNDMAGVDVGTRVRAELAKRESRPPPYHVVSDSLTALGHLGQKSGRGIYRYEAADRTPLPNPELKLLTQALAEKYGVAVREVSDQEIEERCGARPCRPLCRDRRLGVRGWPPGPQERPRLVRVFKRPARRRPGGD
jgi:3-hydroxyacyl-CoA dehydrogenase